jgi:hypothetical protein
MNRTITTLHEYRTLYPESAAIPTLTQSEPYLPQSSSKNWLFVSGWPVFGRAGYSKMVQQSGYEIHVARWRKGKWGWI